MPAAPAPPNEAQRLERLRRFGVLDTLPQEAFENITALASAICETPVALISFVDEDRQWFKSRVGLEVQQTPRELAFCAHAIRHPQHVMVIEDATRDPRFSDNPLVLEEPRIRFYAGAPIVTEDGMALGTVCVIDQQPRTLSDAQHAALRSLASLVLTLLTHEEERQELHRQREQSAARESEILTSLTAAGLDLLSFVDTDYTYRYVNQCHLDYWQKPRSEVVGRRMSDVMGPLVFAHVVKHHFDRALAGEEVAYETEIEFPGRGIRAMEVSYLPVRGNDGRVRGVVIRSHDIHALRMREERLKATVEQLEVKALEQQRFIHIVSHDLREPVNTICNFAGLLAEENGLDPANPRGRYLNFVLEGSQRIRTLLDDLVELLLLERHSLTLVPVDLNLVARHVRDDLQAALKQSGGTLSIGRLPVVLGDATLLRILFQNLVANALKFCPTDRKPVVTLDTVSETGKPRVRVGDNGIGIPRDQHDHIFEMFTRLHNKREFAGSGLGLSICRRIAELHHGRILVESQLGNGSRFDVELMGPDDDVSEASSL